MPRVSQRAPWEAPQDPPLLPRCSLMQNSAPDHSEVLEDTEVRQAVWPRGDVQVTCGHRVRLGVWGQEEDPRPHQSRMQRSKAHL